MDIACNFEPLPWMDFWLNPRRLRGSDFLMRWSQGVWSEKRIIEAIHDTTEFFAIPYGPSGTAPKDNIREFELYFENLERAGLGKIKRPDLLIFSSRNRSKVESIIAQNGGLSQLPFIPEEDCSLAMLLEHAILAVECENSLWRARKMPDYATPLRPQKRLGGKLALKKAAVLPTIIIKEEDREPLRQWQRKRRVPLHVWHAFFDIAYGISFDRAEELISEGLTEPTLQIFQAPGGATTKKVIFKHYFHYAYQLGESTREPELAPAFVEDKNGHILPYVTFKGGRLKLSAQILEQLHIMAAKTKA